MKLTSKELREKWLNFYKEKAPQTMPLVTTIVFAYKQKNEPTLSF